MARTRVLALLTPLLLGAALLQPAAATAQEAPAQPSSYTLPGEAVFPEGIAAFDDDFYVTSTTDGTVFRGDVDDPATRVFLPPGSDGRTAAVGLKTSRDGRRLIVAGGATGRVDVYSTRTGRLIRTFTNGGGAGAPTFLNDVAVAPNGDAYVTDSVRPVLYRIPAAQIRNGRRQTQPLQVFRRFGGTAFTYRAGFNANGIAITPAGKYAVIVQSGTGKLFRVGLQDSSVKRVQTGAARVLNGDGLVLRGSTLYVIRNRQELITKIQLSRFARRGTVVSETTDESLAFPTTAAVVGDRMLLVNSQFDRRGQDPQLPFTVSAIPAP